MSDVYARIILLLMGVLLCVCVGAIAAISTLYVTKTTSAYGFDIFLAETSAEIAFDILVLLLLTDWWNRM